MRLFQTTRLIQGCSVLKSSGVMPHQENFGKYNPSDGQISCDFLPKCFEYSTHSNSNYVARVRGMQLLHQELVALSPTYRSEVGVRYLQLKFNIC